MSNRSNDIPEGFKMTELGPLPEKWGVVRLGDMTSMKQGQVLPVSEFHQIGYPVFGANGQIGFYDKYTHYDTAVLVTCRGSTCGFVNVSPTKSFVTNNAMVVTPIDEDRLTKNYLTFALQIADLSNTITGTGQPQITKGKLALVAIPLPPLPEQKAIAGVLFTIQKAIEAQDKIIVAAREMKKSLMRHLFTYGPVLVAEAEQVPLKETEIGQVPEHWEVVRLGQLMSLRTENVLPEDVPDIRYVGLEHMDSGEVNLHRWGRTAQVRSAKSRFYPKDILYGKLRPYLDKAALAEWEGVCSTDILVFTAYNDTAFPEYLAGLLHTRAFIEHAISTTSGVNHPRTSWSSIKGFAAPCPPINEQQEIAHMLSSVDKKIEAEEKRKAALQSLFKTMLHLLMTGRVRVKDLEGQLS